MEQQLFQKNQKVYTSLAGYNIAYTNYLSCQDNSNNDCSPLSTQLDNSYNELNNNIDKLYSQLINRPVNDTNIKGVHKDNNVLRNNLTSQLEELYKTDKYVYNNDLYSMTTLDSSICIGLVWTTVATACLYYIFVKL